MYTVDLYEKYEEQKVRNLLLKNDIDVKYQEVESDFFYILDENMFEDEDDEDVTYDYSSFSCLDKDKEKVQKLLSENNISYSFFKVDPLYNILLEASYGDEYIYSSDEHGCFSVEYVYDNEFEIHHIILKYQKCEENKFQTVATIISDMDDHTCVKMHLDSPDLETQIIENCILVFGTVQLTESQKKLNISILNSFSLSNEYVFDFDKYSEYCFVLETGEKNNYEYTAKGNDIGYWLNGEPCGWGSFATQLSDDSSENQLVSVTGRLASNGKLVDLTEDIKAAILAENAVSEENYEKPIFQVSSGKRMRMFELGIIDDYYYDSYDDEDDF